MKLMNRHVPFFFIFSFLLLLASACRNENADSKLIHLESPGGQLGLDFFLDDSARASYLVCFDGDTLLEPSRLGFLFRDWPALSSGLVIESSEQHEADEKWEMPWGEQHWVRNHYRELAVKLREPGGEKRQFTLRFRLYDDGLGFRYEFPRHQGKDSVVILDELTEFRLAGNYRCWWQPGDWDIYEHLYHDTPFREIDALKYRHHPNLAQSYIPFNAVNTPVTMKTAGGLYLSFHEADLSDFPGMTLRVFPDELRMKSELVGSDRYAWKASRKLPFHTPWRTLQVARRPGELIESKLILNLNEAAKYEVPWFKPMKYVGIWWEMHLGKSSWDLASGRHGATTSKAMRYIDFAAAHHIGGVLVEGWNTGWEHWIGFDDREGVFDFVTPYPDYDLQKVASYAREKGVQLIMHHETSSAPRTYEAQMDTAYALMRQLGIHVVKTGYVGKIIPKGEYHHGQWMVRHYRKALRKAAEYEVAIDAHEPIKATGIRRTYPNFISREGLRGQEFNAWASDGGNPPEHLTIIPFTRMLAGPIDFTPGIFNLKLKPWRDKNQVNTTLAHQLALYVVIYSPVQMAADLIENYEGHPAFQFIEEVPTDWEESHVLQAEIGDYICMARKERNGKNWFLGAITDENGRTLKIPLSFLAPGVRYEAHIYRDGPDAHWDKNPASYRIERKDFVSGDTLTARLAPGGGIALSFFPLDR